MIGFWLIALALTALVMALVVLPLLRRVAPPPDRLAYDLAVYRDQLAEIDRDIERGLLHPDRAEAARLEIKRRILSSSPPAEKSPARKPQSAPFLAALLATVIPLAAIGAYWQLGEPGGSNNTTIAADDDASSLTMEEAIARLQQRLDDDPDNLEGWLLLGRSYLSLGRPAEAVAAYRTAVGLSGQRSDVVADYGEALVAAEQGRVSPMAMSMFERAMTDDPTDAKARYYIALGKAQRGDLQGALQDWADVVALSPQQAPWVPAVREQMARAASELGVDPRDIEPSAGVRALVGAAPRAAPQESGPSAEDMAAAEGMSAEERSDMVRAMVDRLAARLADDPDNLEGWLRLARAYDVIGEPDKAREARARAEALQRQ